MRTVKLIVMAMLFAFTASLAHAGTQVKRNQYTTVKAAVANKTTKSVYAAVKLNGFDSAGVAIAKLCKGVYLAAGRSTTVEYSWLTPNYATGVYWSPKVEVGKSCPSTVYVPTYHDDDDDDDDHDGDDDHDDDHHEHGDDD